MTARAERIMTHDPATCPAFGGCNDCRIAKFEAASPDVIGAAPVIDDDWLATLRADTDRIAVDLTPPGPAFVDPREPYTDPWVDPEDRPAEPPVDAPAFTAAADPTLARARAIYNQRGGEYGDTWALENIVTTYLDGVLHMLGIFGLSLAERRLLEMGSLVDVKESRLKHGPWKLDNSDDGINYRAAFSAWREEYRRENSV